MIPFPQFLNQADGETYWQNPAVEPKAGLANFNVCYIYYYARFKKTISIMRVPSLHIVLSDITKEFTASRLLFWNNKIIESDRVRL